ncbi:MAG: hypothetical protein IIB62_07130, partial [Proteobacteria bacterium]|nr:hypothetical protein [Pseudomonadota bacterium]
MSKPSTPPAPPVAEKRPLRDTRHGFERVDDYAWLRADNWQEVMRDPSVLDAGIRGYLEAENAYMAAVMSGTDKLQAKLFAEMKGRIKEDDSSVPAADGRFAYYARYVTGGQHPLYCRSARDGDAIDETILIDGNKLAAPHAYFRIGGVAHSPDHRLVAWASDTKGSEYYALRVLDIDSGEQIGAPIADTNGGGVWANDGKTLFYAKLDDNHRPSRIFRHTIGTPPENDILVYEEADPGFFAGVGLTQSFAMELVTDGIKVNSICPGNFLDGPLWSDPDNGLFVQYLRAKKIPGAKTVQDVRRAYEEMVPMARGCRTEDVMKAIYYVMEQKYETG